MRLSFRQKRLARESILKRFPGAEVVRMQSIQKSYTDSKVKIILREVGLEKEQVHYLDLKYLVDGKGQPAI